MKTIIGISLLLMVSAGAVQAMDVGVAKFAENQLQHVVLANNIQWKPCPPTLPKPCEMSILSGHPKKPDMFTVRFRAPADMYMPPHTHPKDERVTILEGKAAVAFGANAERNTAKEFGPGDYYINRRDSVHIVWLSKGTILQITGIGPWEAHYVDKH